MTLNRLTAKITLIFTITFGILINITHALIISAPPNGATVQEGETITVRAEPTPEDPPLLYVMFSIGPELEDLQCFQRILLPPYECNFKVPRGVSYTSINALAQPVEGNQTIVSPEIKLNVRIPSTVILQGLRVNDDQRTIFPVVGTIKKLYIYGKYSDGFDRRLDDPATGTTYETSDPKIATVDIKGLVTAVAPGKAVITVKNGDKRLQIQVVVSKE